jgi:hypothetical protein
MRETSTLTQTDTTIMTLDNIPYSQGEEWQNFRSKVNQTMMQPRSTKLYVGPIDAVASVFINRYVVRLCVTLHLSNNVAQLSVSSCSVSVYSCDVAASSVVQCDIHNALLPECTVETVGKYCGRAFKCDSNAHLL